MSNLHRSGIAMVYGLQVNADDNGLIVQTEFPVTENSSFLNPVTGNYQQYLDTGTAWLCTGDIEPLWFAMYDPRNLMPIDNTDPDTAETLNSNNLALCGWF